MNDQRTIPSWPGWETKSIIGHGSFGTVYAIERKIRNSVERAALKVIRMPKAENEINQLRADGYSDAGIARYFKDNLEKIEKEYAYMAVLKGHSNVVYCDDLIELPHSDGLGWDVYIKMELLTPIKQCIGEHPADELVIKLGMDICQALQFCQKQIPKIVHRDIKPENIFVSRDGTFKLGDFGIAKSIEGAAVGTKTGTYEYMAPEIYNNQLSDEQADVYSLGMVMYWMLNQHSGPFLTPMPTVTEKMQARDRRFGGEALPTPAHGSAALQRIVLKACAFDRRMRYQNAEELWYALSDLNRKANAPNENSKIFAQVQPLDWEKSEENGETTLGPRFGPKPKEKAAYKKKTFLFAGIAAVLVAAIGIGIWLGTGNEKTEAPEEAPVPQPYSNQMTEAPEKPAVPEPKRKDWEDVYGTVIQEYGETLNFVEPERDVYALYDFTADGTPELFLQKDGIYDVYTYTGTGLATLGQVPGHPFSICPLDDANGFLSVMQNQYCETVYWYTYNDEKVCLEKEELLFEASIETFPQDGSVPLDDLGYHAFESLTQYQVDDLSGLLWEKDVPTENQKILSAIEALDQQSETAKFEMLGLWEYVSSHKVNGYVGIFENGSIIRFGSRWMDIGTWELNQFGEIDASFHLCYERQAGDVWELHSEIAKTSYAYEPAYASIWMTSSTPTNDLTEAGGFKATNSYEAYASFSKQIDTFNEVDMNRWLSQWDINAGTKTVADLWIGLETDLYQYLLSQQSGNLLERLMEEEAQWARKKDDLVNKTKKEHENGSQCSMMMNLAKSRVTCERVSQLLEMMPDAAEYAETSDYILPDSNSRYLSNEDLKELSHQELSLARNEILARYGFIFATPELADYFSQKDWYEATLSYEYYSEDVLNKYEVFNMDLIAYYERENFGGSYYSK